MAGDASAKERTTRRLTTVKIFALIEHPSIGRIKRGRLQAALQKKGFLSLPGTLTGWVSDHVYSTVDEARHALAEASEVARVSIQKAYVIEYGSFTVIS